MNLLLYLLAQHPSVDMALLTGSRQLDAADAHNFGVDWVIHYKFEDTGMLFFQYSFMSSYSSIPSC